MTCCPPPLANRVPELDRTPRHPSVPRPGMASVTMWAPHPHPRTTPACSPHIQVHFQRGKPRWSVCGGGTPSQRSQSRGTVARDCQGAHHCKDKDTPFRTTQHRSRKQARPLLARGPVPTHGYTLGGELCQHRAWGQLLFHLPGPALAWLLGSQAPPPYGHPRNFLPSRPALPWSGPTHPPSWD